MLASRSGSSVPVGDRGLHRTARLVLVLAVAEAAVVHQLEHIGEGPLDAVTAAPQADGAHAGRVDQPAAARQADQLGGDRGVAAAAVALAYGCGGLRTAADEGVDQRALADATRTRAERWLRCPRRTRPARRRPRR